jgi:hypothetical protein
LKQRLIVEHHPRHALLVFAQSDFAHGKVAGDLIPLFAFDADLQVVEERRIGGPQLGLGELEDDGLLGHAAVVVMGDDFAVAVADDDARITPPLLADDIERDLDLAGIDLGSDPQAADVFGGDFFEPDGLPDAGGGRVPDAFGLADLFAAGLPVGVARVGDGYDEVLLGFGFVEGVGDVEGEGVVAAGVVADFFAVDGDFAFPIDGAEVEEEATGVFEVGRVEGAVIDELVIRANSFHDAGEGRFDGEGDEDLAVIFAWQARSLPHDGIVPEAVEVGPVVANELGAGVFGVDIGGRNILGPAGHERAGGRFPIGGADGG